MHLSILSDAFVSDRLGDAGSIGDAAEARRAQRAHWDGMLRGLVLLGVFAVVIALTLLSNAAHTYETAIAVEAAAPPTLIMQADLPEEKVVRRFVYQPE